MKTFLVAAIPILSLFLGLSLAAAQGTIYKWVDAQGIVHFSNAPTNRAVPVDDELPPAASFTAPPEPPSSIVATEPASDAPTPPPETALEPPADADPTAENEPASAEDEPTAIEEEIPTPLPQASADLLEPGETDDFAQDDFDSDEQFEAEETDEADIE